MGATASEGITKAQLKGIWVRVGKFARKTGMSRGQAEEAMRSYVRHLTDQDSTRQLTREQADEVHDYLDSLIRKHGGKVQTQPKRRATTRGGRDATEDMDAPITVAQSERLLRLAREIGWNRFQLQAHIRKQVAVTNGLPWPQTRGQAMKIDEGLKRILERQGRCSHEGMAERAREALELDGLTPWERDFLVDLAAKAPNRITGQMVAKLSEIERRRGPEGES